MAPEADPCAGDTYGPGDTCVVCSDMNVGLAQECSHPHDTPARAPQRPQPDRRETPLRAAGGVYHAASPTRSGELARTIPQPRIQLPHTESKNPCTHCQPASPDSARVPNRLPEHGACDSGPRLTGPGLGDVAVRLRRASLRPGPATADGFAQLRLRRQAPDIQGRWSRATGTWHMTPREFPWEERHTPTDGADSRKRGSWGRAGGLGR